MTDRKYAEREREKVIIAVVEIFHGIPAAFSSFHTSAAAQFILFSFLSRGSDKKSLVGSQERPVFF